MCYSGPQNCKAAIDDLAIDQCSGNKFISLKQKYQ